MSRTIKFTDVEQAKQLIDLASGCDFKVTLTSDHITVDAASIIGVFGMNLAENIVIRAYGQDEELEEFIQEMAV